VEKHSGHAAHQPNAQSHDEKHARHAAHQPYGHFGIELIADFVVMYLVMYTMIATLGHFYVNVNNVYMTLMMVAPMAAIMLISMRAMFTDRRRNTLILIGAAAIFSASFAAMRTQAGVGDRQFLKSMIPHHSGAILMCQEASLTDPQIVALCGEIIRSQTAEIATMQAILARQ
jgi:uncharacterized protein (DUF305 family)